MIDNLILGLLLYKDLTIYDLRKALQENINQFFTTSLGAIHPALQKLAGKKYVAVRSATENGRRKRIYSLTPAGKQCFRQWLAEDIETKKAQEEGLLRIYFYNEIPPEKQTALLGKYVATLQKHRQGLKELDRKLKGMKVPPPYREAFNYRTATLDFGLKYYSFVIGWYRRFIRRLQTGEVSQ